MSLLRSRSSSNILIKKSTNKGRNKHYWNSGYDTLEKTDIQLAFYTKTFRLIKAHALNRFPYTTFILPTTTSTAKELTLLYETQVTREINMTPEGEGPYFDNKEGIFLIFTNFRKLGRILIKCSLKETLNISLRL